MLIVYFDTSTKVLILAQVGGVTITSVESSLALISKDIFR